MSTKPLSLLVPRSARSGCVKPEAARPRERRNDAAAGEAPAPAAAPASQPAQPGKAAEPMPPMPPGTRRELFAGPKLGWVDPYSPAHLRG